MPIEQPAGDPPVLRPSQSPGHLIRRIQSVHGVLWADLVGPEVTGPQFAVLVSLAGRPGSDQQSVGRLASLDRSSTADVVARLVKAGWIVRTTHSDDGRRRALSLSRGARGELRRITPRVQRVQTQLLQGLPPDRAAELMRCLRLLAYQGLPLGDDTPFDREVKFHDS